MKSTALQSAIMYGAALLLLAACSSNAAEKAKGTAAAPAPGLPADVIIVKEQPLQESETVAGSVVPNRTVEIMSEMTKKITAVSFRDGSLVQRGQVLYKLDDADILAKLRQLQAELNLARINETRMSELLKTETVRREEYDIALAKLQSLQAAREILQVELSKTYIRAPFTGIIGITRAFTGTLVSPGMPLVSLQEQGTLKIQFTVPEKYLSLVTPGKKVQFSTELGDEKIPATIVSSEAAVDMQSRNITVQASLPNPDNRFRAGMSARVYFNTGGENSTGIFAPTEALIPGAQGYQVFLVKNGEARLTPVSILNRNERSARISSGIAPGDTLMISNILRASEGTPVSIVSIQ